MNILLLTDIPPCQNYTAGIVLNLLCDLLIKKSHHIFCYCVKSPGLDAKVPEEKREIISWKYVEKPCEDYGNHKGGKYCSFLGHAYNRYIKLPKIEKDAADYINLNQISLIWSVVQGETMIKIVYPISQMSKTPYVVQIWDPPQWWLQEHRFDRFSFRSVMHSYKQLLENAECCLTASWAMSEIYEERYNCKRTVPVILGLEDQGQHRNVKQNSSEFIIALSGQIYATDEFYALIDALNLLQWNYNGKKIILKLYGRYFHLYFKESANIVVRGWINQEELIEELISADLLYCPYWFDPYYREPCELSFPSKLSTYLKLGKPVLFHGPEYASPGKFLKDNNAGYLCNSRNYIDIAEKLKFIITDTSIEDVAYRGYTAFKHHLTLSHMETAFLSALFGETN